MKILNRVNRRDVEAQITNSNSPQRHQGTSVRATIGPGCSFWPTPTACNNGNRMDLAVDEEGFTFELTRGQRGKQKGPQQAAKTWTILWLMIRAAGFRPGRRAAMTCRSSPPLRATLRPGTDAFESALIYNPRFTEWLMGWPIGWTDCRAPVTAFAPWLRRMRTELSMLPSPEGAHQVAQQF